MSDYALTRKMEGACADGPAAEAREEPTERSQKLFYRILSELGSGSLVVTDHEGRERVFGRANGALRAHVRVRDRAFFDRVLQTGPLGLGEAYMDGLWEVVDGDLADLFELVFASKLDEVVRGSRKLRALLLLNRALSMATGRKAARRNVQAHYDLGNEFFRHMLDDSMTYSCGYQRREGDALSSLQQQKHEKVYNKLGLERGGRLVDIGCGWGGFLLHAARRNPNIQAVGITLSDEQLRFARERVAAEGLSDRVAIELCDFRDLTGTFDFVVSVGMFEHVGLKGYDDFFEVVKRVLHPRGVGLLHTIGLELPPSAAPDPWIRKYIFPGSRLPRLEEVARGLRQAELGVLHVENLRPHYALTLRRWRERFLEHWQEIRTLGPRFDDRFKRMWEYYLQICEACFRNTGTEVYQVCFCPRDRWNLPLVLPM